jgi:hypothetical protein
VKNGAAPATSSPTIEAIRTRRREREIPRDILESLHVHLQVQANLRRRA